MQKLVNILTIVILVLLLAVLQACSSTRVVASRDMDLVRLFSAKNSKFIIKEDIDLKGKTIILGNGCTLVFLGGSFSNGTIVGNNTKIKAENYEIFKRGSTRYRAYKEKGASEKMPPTLKKEYRNSIIIEGTWNNNQCGSNWTGLLNDSNEDVMLAVKNFVVLHQEGATVTFPTFIALGYEGTKLPGNRLIDFSGSIISYPDNLEGWVDKLITLPTGVTPCPMETGYGLITMDSNTTISNLTIDGKSTMRPNEPLKLGVSCLLNLGNANNVSIENVTLQNALGPAVVTHPKSRDVSFKNCRFLNIGEHVIYAQQYLGYCHFEGCIFDTWDSVRLSVYRNGLNYLYKHTPLSGSENVPYEEMYKFDLSFTDCFFDNPKRVNSQGRTLGGFLTGDFPVVVKLNHCKFTGVMPILNPGGKEIISEKTGKSFRMIVRDCDGAPVAYASKSNYNLITEFYNCKNIPFCSVYAKRYENCELYLDIYEDNLENISESFIDEFSQPLVIKDCEFYDRGSNVRIHHPISHRPVIFENCSFKSSIERDYTTELISIKEDGILRVEFRGCNFDLNNYRIVGGGKIVGHFSVRNCIFKESTKTMSISAKEKQISNNIGFDSF